MATTKVIVQIHERTTEVLIDADLQLRELGYISNTKVIRFNENGGTKHNVWMQDSSTPSFDNLLTLLNGLTLQSATTAGNTLTFSQTTGGFTSTIAQGASTLNINALGAQGISVATNGTERLSVNSAGASTFTGTLDVTGGALTVIGSAPSVSLNNTSGSGRHWRLIPETDGSMSIRDQTAGLTRAAFYTNGNFAAFYGLEVTANADITLSSTSEMYSATNTDQIIISGGSSGAAGGNVIFYGGSHATNANSIHFRNGSSVTSYIAASGNYIASYGVTIGANYDLTLNANSDLSLSTTSQIVGAGDVILNPVTNVVITNLQDAYLDIKSDSNASGTNDNAIRLFTDGGATADWAFGFDESDSGAFVISKDSNTLGTGNALRIDETSITIGKVTAGGTIGSGRKLIFTGDSTSAFIEYLPCSAKFYVDTVTAFAGGLISDGRLILSHEAGWDSGAETSLGTGASNGTNADAARDSLTGKSIIDVAPTSAGVNDFYGFTNLSSRNEYTIINTGSVAANFIVAVGTTTQFSVNAGEKRTFVHYGAAHYPEAVT